MLPTWTYSVDPFTLPKLACFAAGVVALWGAREWRPRRLTPLDVSVIAMLCAVYITSAVSNDWRASIYGERGYYFCSCITATLYALAYFGAQDVEPADVARAIVVGATIVSVYAIVQQRFDLLPFELPDHRSIGTIGSPPMLGCVLAVCLPFVLAKKTPILTALIVVAIALTGSRAAYLASGAAAAVLLAENYGLTLMGSLGGVAFFCASLLVGKHHGDNLRIETWLTAARIFHAHPVFGVGPETFMNAFRTHRADMWIGFSSSYQMVQNNAHNDILHVAATMGMVGLLTYGWLTSVALTTLHGRSRTALAAVVAALVYAKFDPTPFTAQALLAVIVGSACGTAYYGPAKPETAWRWAAGFIPAAVCFCLAIQMLAADVSFRCGTVDSVKDALDIMPTEAGYRMAAVDSLYDMWRGGRKEALAEAELIASDNALSHPNDVQARELAGISEALLAIHTNHPGPPSRDASDLYTRARINLDQAETLDHNTLQAWEVQAHLCAHFRDVACFREAVANISRISNAEHLKTAEGMVCKLDRLPWKDHR